MHSSLDLRGEWYSVIEKELVCIEISVLQFDEAKFLCSDRAS